MRRGSPGRNIWPLTLMRRWCRGSISQREEDPLREDAVECEPVPEVGTQRGGERGGQLPQIPFSPAREPALPTGAGE